MLRIEIAVKLGTSNKAPEIGVIMFEKSKRADWLAAIAAIAAAIISTLVYFQTGQLAKAQRSTSEKLVRMESSLSMQREATSVAVTDAFASYRDIYGQIYVLDVPGWTKSRLETEETVYKGIGRLIGARKQINIFMANDCDEATSLVSRWQNLASVSNSLDQKLPHACSPVPDSAEKYEAASLVA